MGKDVGGELGKNGSEGVGEMGGGRCAIPTEEPIGEQIPKEQIH